MVAWPLRPTGRGALRRVLGVSAVAALAATLAACSSGSSTSAGQFGFPEASQSGGTITVWVDNTRVAAADAFKKANPKIPINVVTYDGSANGSNSFQTKITLFDEAGKGWPDVVFSSQNNDASWASQKVNGKQAFAATLNKGLVDTSTVDGFAKGSLNSCTVDGQVYCLRNDLAQTVLWYNHSLLTKFGYTVPKTWQEYQALGDKVAKEHPGYIVGSVGDAWTPETYFWASKCQANDVTAIRSITVNTDSTQCKRAASLLDDLVSNGTMAKESVFAPQFVQQYAGKVLMMPGPAWFAGSILQSKTSLNVPARQMAVATPLAWGNENPVTGNVGGGTWFISSHSTNLKAAQEFVKFVSTSDAYQVDLAPGYPAYSSAAQKWVAKQEAGNYFVGDLSSLTTAASQVWPGWGAPQFSQEAIWAKTMTSHITSGEKIVDLLPTWQKAIENQAQVSGYKVN